MGRARRSNCRLCTKPTPRNEITTINNLPKTFAHILEEISGLKFTEADGLQINVCVRCNDFLQAMEHQPQYPKPFKISGAGKKKVRRLIESGVSASDAYTKVITEQRARALLSESVLPVQGGPSANVPQAPVILQNTNGIAGPADRPRLSGAQRKKIQILVAGGIDMNQARQLVMAARATAGGNQPQLAGLAQSAPGQRGVIQTGAVQRMPDQRVVVQKGAVQRIPGQRVVVQKGAMQGKPGQKVVIQTGAVQRIPAQRVVVQKGVAKNVPVQKGTAQNGPVQKANAQKRAPQNATAGGAQRVPNQRNVQNANAVYNQQNRQNNNTAGRVQNAVGRRNERPAPYNINNRVNSQNRQQNNNVGQNDEFNQQSCSLEVGIIPINFPNVQLDDMKLDALKEAITNEIFKIAPGGPLIRFLGTSSQNGWLKVICADEMSHNWLAQLVARWERAGVRMVEGNSLPQPVVLTFYLPGDFRSPNEILTILEKQNNSLNTNQWRIINSENDPNGQSITVCVDEQSFQALQSRDFMVFLGLGVVELKPRRFPSDGGSVSFNAPMQNAMGNGNNMNNNRSNYGNGNNSQGYYNGGGGDGMGNSNRSRNSGGGGGPYQRQGMGQGQNFQRAGYQSQRSW